MSTKRRHKAQPRWSTSLEPEPVETEVLTAEGAGRLLGVSPRLVLQLARQKKLPARKIGREWRFRRSALLAWLGKVDQPPEWLRPLLESGQAELINKKPKP